MRGVMLAALLARRAGPFDETRVTLKTRLRIGSKLNEPTLWQTLTVVSLVMPNVGHFGAVSHDEPVICGRSGR